MKIIKPLKSRHNHLTVTFIQRLYFSLMQTWKVHELLLIHYPYPRGGKEGNDEVVVSCA